MLAAYLVVRGIGLGAITMPVMTASYVGLGRDAVAHSSVLTRTTQQLGGSFGTAVLAVLLTSQGFHAAFWWATAFALEATVTTSGRL